MAGSNCVDIEFATVGEADNALSHDGKEVDIGDPPVRIYLGVKPTRSVAIQQRRVLSERRRRGAPRPRRRRDCGIDAGGHLERSSW